MDLRFPHQKLESIFFVTTTFHRWTPFGDRYGVYESLSNNLQYYAKKYQARLPAYVLMPTHLHLLIVIDGSRLSDFMRDFKKFISQRAFPSIGIPEKPIWEQRYDRQALQSESLFRTKLDYIHQNPVKAGLVEVAGDWPWSSAGAYLTGRESVVHVWRDWC